MIRMVLGEYYYMNIICASPLSKQKPQNSFEFQTALFETCLNFKIQFIWAAIKWARSPQKYTFLLLRCYNKILIDSRRDYVLSSELKLYE